jgi:YbbR domain-containing protein
LRSSFFKKTEGPQGQETIRLNRRLVSFLFCVVVSAFFWLLLSLSKEYNIVLSFPVEYLNQPEDKVIANDLPSRIEIEIRARGFDLVGYKLNPERETIRIDLRDARASGTKNHSFLLTNSHTDKVTAQFSSNIHIIQIAPDTIFLDFNKKTSKKVPVKALLKIECEDEYELVDSVRVSPAYMEVTGGADALANIDTLRTYPMTLKNVKNSVLMKMNIRKTPELKQVDLTQQTVEVAAEVAKYTEASIELPVEVENLPQGYGLKTFPDKVTVKYRVRFEDYEKINTSMFRAVVDYSKIAEGSNKLKVSLTKSPALVRALKLSTERVEYIIRK